jgi:hypothetical protein
MKILEYDFEKTPIELPGFSGYQRFITKNSISILTESHLIRRQTSAKGETKEVNLHWSKLKEETMNHSII